VAVNAAEANTATASSDLPVLEAADFTCCSFHFAAVQSSHCATADGVRYATEGV
jgi:hypothetical protein